MKDIANIIRISIKKEFKKLRNKSPIFCNSLNQKVFINNLYLKHINWDSKDRGLKDVISRLPIINLIDDILKSWKLTEKRTEKWFTYYRIERKIEWIIFCLIISETKNKNLTLLSSFAITKKISSSQGEFPRRPTRVQSSDILQLPEDQKKYKNINNNVNNNLIQKAIIPIAGLWTRFLPITKSVWKEMLNIVDKPVIHYILEECINSWISEITFVISENQNLIKNYFNLESEYCKKIFSSWNKEKIAKLDDLKKILKNIKINFIIQKNPKWDWDAILQAKKFFKEWENFAILFWDDLIQNKENPWIWQLTKKFSEQEKIFPNKKIFIIWVQKISWEEIKNYWVIWVDKNFKVNQIQEKPEFKDAVSDLWIIWKYICNYNIFDAIENWNKNWESSSDWEIRLSDGFKELLKNSEKYNSQLFWKIIEWERYDTWSKNGFIKATIWFWIEKWIINKEEILYLIKKL